MHGIGKGSTSPSAEDTEVFSSLKLVEPNERVTVRLDERMLHLEGRRVSNTLRLSSIDQTDHTSTTWVPGWAVFVGLVSLWIGYRVMLDPTWQLGFILFGAALVGARLLSRRPTLLIHTSQGGVQALIGNEGALYRLNFMLNKMIKFHSMTLARQSWDQHVANSMGTESLTVSAPVSAIQTPHAIHSLLHIHDEGEDVPEPMDGFEPEWKPTDEPQPSEPFLPSYMPVHGVQHATEVAQYPSQHRPQPTHNPVLVPTHVAVVPSMHQTVTSLPATGPQDYIPSFWSSEEAHIPFTPPLPDDEELLQGGADEDPSPELEVIEEDDVSPSVASPTSTMVQRSSPVFVRRTATKKSSNLFVPKQQRGLRPRRTDSPSYGAMVRGAVEAGLTRLRNRPAPQTAQGMRDTAQQSNIEQHQSFSSLEDSLGPEHTERYREKFNTMLEESNRLDLATTVPSLDGLTFNDLEATTTVDDEPGLQEL